MSPTTLSPVISTRPTCYAFSILLGFWRDLDLVMTNRVTEEETFTDLQDQRAYYMLLGHLSYLKQRPAILHSMPIPR